MPTYQYACTSCAERLEVVQSFTAEPLTECPACGGRLRKVFSPVGVVFKGSGFYKTDSRKRPATAGKAASEGGEAAAATAGKDGAAASGDGAGSDKPADAKPAATAEADVSPGGSSGGSDGKAGDKPAAKPNRPSTGSTPAK